MPPSPSQSVPPSSRTAQHLALTVCKHPRVRFDLLALHDLPTVLPDISVAVNPSVVASITDQQPYWSFPRFFSSSLAFVAFVVRKPLQVNAPNSS